MKCFRTLLFTCSFVAGSHTITKAQKSTSVSDTLRLSLQEVWRKAEQYSKLIALQKKDVQIKYEEIRDAGMERLPELSVYGSAEKATNIPIYEHGLFSPPQQHEVIHTLYRAGADMYLSIYDGNKLNLKIEEDKILHGIASIQQNQAVSDIRYQVTALYLDLQKSAIFSTLMKQDIANQEKQLTEIKSFYRNGVVLKSDVLRVELELSKRKLALIQIGNDLLITMQKLNIIIREPDERITYPETLQNLEEKSVASYDDCLAQAFQSSYDYRISKQKTEASKIHVREIAANVRPKVGMYGDFYYANPQIFLYPYNPYWYSLGIAGVRAAFPISSVYYNLHKIRTAKLELEKEEIAHEHTKDRIRQQVKEAYLRYEEALIKIGVTQVNVAQADENARIIKSTYFHQTSLVTDLLDADVQLLQTQFEFAAARILAQNRYFLLQNIIGTL